MMMMSERRSGACSWMVHVLMLLHLCYSVSTTTQHGHHHQHNHHHAFNDEEIQDFRKPSQRG